MQTFLGKILQAFLREGWRGVMIRASWRWTSWRGNRPLAAPTPAGVVAEGDASAQISRIMANSAPPTAPAAGSRQDGARVLILSIRGGWTTHSAIESVLGCALRARGADVLCFSCSGLPLCDIRTFRERTPPPCKTCTGYGDQTIGGFRLPHARLSDYVDADARQLAAGLVDGKSFQELEALEYDGLAVGQFALISTRWFSIRSTLMDIEEHMTRYRLFVLESILMAIAAKRMFASFRPSCVIMLNGLFAAEQTMWAVARRAGIRVVTYERGFAKGTLRFADNAIACRYEIDDLWAAVGNKPLTAAQLQKLDAWFAKWRGGSLGLFNYWPKANAEATAIRAELNLDEGRPIVTVFTNVVWDSAVQGRDVMFGGMLEWVVETIRYFAQDPARGQLVIRVHPAEIRVGGHETEERVVDGLRAAFPKLPDNVRVIPPESVFSSYTLVDMSRCVLVYTSTIGMESALAGKRVIVAGQTHYRGKGFTDDPQTRDDFFATINRALTEDHDQPTRLDLARRYAYAFALRSMLPFDLISEPRPEVPVYQFQSLEDLAEGKNRTLDLICDGILKGHPFYQDE